MISQSNRLIAIIVVFSSFFISSACSKSNTKSKTDLLTSGSWKIVAITISPAQDLNGDGIPDTDFFALAYENCSKDDFFTFNKDDTGVQNEGPTKCDPSDPQTTTLNWLFKTNETILQIKQDIIALDFTIIELTESTLKISYSQTDSGVTSTQTITYTH